LGNDLLQAAFVFGITELTLEGDAIIFRTVVIIFSPRRSLRGGTPAACRSAGFLVEGIPRKTIPMKKSVQLADRDLRQTPTSAADEKIIL
jgi:hypothetical protein